MPVAFLILGAECLDTILPDVVSKTWWIFIYALAQIPICLIPTLREGLIAAVVGSVAVIVTLAFCITTMYINLYSESSEIKSPNFSLSETISTFGNSQ